MVKGSEIGEMEPIERREVPDDISDRPLVFQNLDCTYSMKLCDGVPSKKAVIKVYGVTENGNSVLLHVHGFLPYFYIGMQDIKLSPAQCDQFMDDLNEKYELQKVLTTLEMQGKPILKVEQMQKTSIWGYQTPGVNNNFLKITCAAPTLIPTCKNLLKNGTQISSFGDSTYQFQTYESNLPYTLRFMIDKGICGGSWMELSSKMFSIRREKTTHCQIEADCHYSSIISHPSEGEWLKIAPIRILSFDIECASRPNVFPEPEFDPVIQIALCVTLQGEEEPFYKAVLTLKSCAPIAGAHVLSFEEEGDMMKAFGELIIRLDPDVFTGYNIMNFDWPYLMERCNTLKGSALDFFKISREIGGIARIKDARFSSKAYGTRESKEVTVEGRIQFDIFQIIQREYKLRSYSLNSVSAHFLKQQKEDVHYSIITDLQNGDAETRRRLAVYCLKDAILPLKLLNKLLLFINYTEMARVTGVPIEYLLSRGQQIKVVSQLYRKANAKNFIIPVLEKEESSETYEGATVFDPIKGYYKNPIATLDFSSLYPSIMMAHNLCYTTLLSSDDVKQFDKEDVTKTPTGDYFIKKSKRPGLLPEILKELLDARKVAKKDMKAATDPLRKAVLNGRQLALKISANSVYGFTGATVGQLPCLAISSSVTSFGRDMIDETKKIVEREYSKAKGFKEDVVVIYGDTDSVMVNFKVDSVEEAMRLGKEAAAMVTKHFVNPINLEFEKVYFPYLLMNKKRYAGLYWTEPDKWSKMDCKGIETVRRDTCELVKNVVETCLDYILIKRNEDDAIDYVKGMISDLLCNKIDLSQLVITKSLSKPFTGKNAYASKLAHVELAKRMQKRDPGSAPQMGDRVAYIITKGAKNAKAYEKAEDPMYVLEFNIPIDTQYYLNNQLKLPLERLFEPIVGDVRKILEGDHTRSIKVASSSLGIMKFAVKSKKCLGCRVPLKKTGILLNLFLLE